MSKWKDFDEVIKPTRVPKELWHMENLMKEIPNNSNKGCSDYEYKKKKRKS